jgi:DNA-binding PadR family transcriptional regulator
LSASRREKPVAKRRKVGNLLALSLLSLLWQRPMYPYEMAQTLRVRGKENNFKINWGSLYTVVQNLEKYGFIETAVIDRDGRQPERTTYEITEPGRAELRDWMHELLITPDEEHGGFVTALSEAGVLPPDEVISLLGTRLAALDEANAERAADLKMWGERLPRILLVESEYQHAMRVAQANWVRGLITELTEGTISGMDGWRLVHKTGQLPSDFQEFDELAKRGWVDSSENDSSEGGPSQPLLKPRPRERSSHRGSGGSPPRVDTAGHWEDERSSSNTVTRLDPGPRCCNTANRDRNLTTSPAPSGVNRQP